MTIFLVLLVICLAALYLMERGKRIKTQHDASLYKSLALISLGAIFLKNVGHKK